LRLGSNPRCLVATTPRPTKLIRELLARERCDVAVTRGSTYENRANLARGFFDQVIGKYEGTRLGRQELNAELLEDTPGALWSHGIIDAARQAAAPNLARIVVAVDPAASSGEDADETGIVIVGKDNQDHGYVLADASGKHQPIEWAKIAITAYRAHHADRIVAERNNGGAMVEATIRMVDSNLPVTTVWASRGKVARAEPVSALYEQGRVHHIGAFPHLEDQMCAFTTDFDRASAGYSPDRVDALVWALTELLVQPMPGYGAFEYARQQAEALKARPKEEAQPVIAPGSVEWTIAQSAAANRS
jgi:predicted phage terminase large subunit-like protein